MQSRGGLSDDYPNTLNDGRSSPRSDALPVIPVGDCQNCHPSESSRYSYVTPYTKQFGYTHLDPTASPQAHSPSEHRQHIQLYCY